MVVFYVNIMLYDLQEVISLLALEVLGGAVTLGLGTRRTDQRDRRGEFDSVFIRGPWFPTARQTLPGLGLWRHRA